LGGKLTEGGSQRASGGRSWTGGKGGVKWCSWRACEGGREGAQRGGRRRRCLLSVRRVAGEGGGSEAESTWKRETDRERGGGLARRPATSRGRQKWTGGMCTRVVRRATDAEIGEGGG
jgi:hypothetical protein